MKKLNSPIRPSLRRAVCAAMALAALMQFFETSTANTSASASGTAIPLATQITDAQYNVWTVTSGVVYENGKKAAYTANVSLLLYYNGVIYQENSAQGWWSWTNGAWVAGNDPRVSTPAPTPTPTPTPTATATPAPVPNGSFGIQISGNKFVSEKDGSLIQLIGANVSGLEGGGTSRWTPFAHAGSAFWSKLKNYKGSGINVARIPLNEAYWLGNACGLSAATYQSTVKKAVADATGAGLYVILDLHWGAPNVADSPCPLGQPGFPDADHAPAFWKSVADTFKNNPAVIFELFNEPYGDNVYGNAVAVGDLQPGNDAFVWRDGGSFSPFVTQDNSASNAIVTKNVSYQVAGAQSLINTIRGEGASNVILTSPIWWAGQIQVWLASRPSDPLGQLGVAWHVYDFNRGTAGPLAVLAAGFPIAITETYGFDSALDGGKSSNGYAWARSHGIGYLCWGVINDWGGGALNPADAWSSCTAQ